MSNQVNLLSLAEVAALPVGSLIFPWKDNRPDDSALVVLPKGKLTQVAWLPERAEGGELDGSPLTDWGYESFALVSKGKDKLSTHGTAQRLVVKWWRALGGV